MVRRGNSVFEEFLDFGGFQAKVVKVNDRRKINTVWFATVWSLWNMRNLMIFENVEYSFDKVCFNVMFYSWTWLYSLNPTVSSCFYNWYKVPLDCFSSA